MTDAAAAVPIPAATCAPQPGDDDLVAGLLDRGDPGLFRALVERHRGPVHRLVVSVLAPELTADAEDVSQEVFLRCFRRLSTYRRESRFSTWLYRVAYTTAIDHRRRARHRETPTDPAELPARGGTDRPSLAPEDRAALRRCLARLPDLDRTVLHLYYWMGCTVREVGELVGAPPGTIQSCLFRAREKLARRLGPEDADGR